MAFTGGGGKTSLALSVAKELEREGRPAVVTTTTRIWPPEAGEPPLVLLEGSADLSRVASALAAGHSVWVGERIDPATGKVVGVDPAMVAHLRSLGAGAVLVEADGSAGRPLKAPADHEPVIPHCADLVVPVAGATALGRPLAPPAVHRPDRVAGAAGLAPGDVAAATVTPTVMAAALRACTRGRPPDARVVPVIGQADDPQVDPAGPAAVADLLLDAGLAGRVVLAAPRTAAPVRRIFGRVAGLVLAGGASRRFGGAKLLHPWRDRTVLEASLRAPLRAGLHSVTVVTGAYHDRLAPLLAPYPVTVVPNPDWEVGMSTSVKAGLDALAGNDPPAALLICLGDQPLLPPSAIDALAAEYRSTGAALVAPVAGGQRRNPVLFDRRLFAELAGVAGDEGGRSVIRRHEGELRLVTMDEPEWFRDIDTPADLPPA